VCDLSPYPGRVLVVEAPAVEVFYFIEAMRP